jgi:hypothetical protein
MSKLFVARCLNQSHLDQSLIKNSNKIPLLRKGEFGDVIYKADGGPPPAPTDSNIPCVFEVYGASHYTWGYLGCGPHLFAFNILNHFFGEEIARNFTHDFVIDVIAKLPCRESGVLKFETIQAWLNGVKEKKFPMLTSPRLNLPRTPDLFGYPPTCQERREEPAKLSLWETVRQFFS